MLQSGPIRVAIELINIAKALIGTQTTRLSCSVRKNKNVLCLRSSQFYARQRTKRSLAECYLDSTEGSDRKKRAAVVRDTSFFIGITGG